MVSMNYILGQAAFALVILSVKGQGPVEYGEPCGIWDPCNSRDRTDPLVCDDPMEGTCICEEGLFRDPLRNKCVSPEGHVCTICTTPHPFYLWTCTEFADCIKNKDEENCEDLIGAPRPGKIDGSCRCQDGAKRDSATGMCKLEYGSTNCTKPRDCDAERLQTCNGEGKCVCFQEYLQVYDEVTEKCKSLFGGSCEASGTFPAAECADSDTMECKEGKCACKDTFTPGTDLRCHA